MAFTVSAQNENGRDHRNCHFLIFITENEFWSVFSLHVYFSADTFFTLVYSQHTVWLMLWHYFVAAVKIYITSLCSNYLLMCMAIMNVSV